MIPTINNPVFYEMKEPADIQEILRQVNPLSVVQKITQFRKKNIARMSNVEIDQAIFDVLHWNGMFVLYTNLRTYPAGTTFYRVKKLKGTILPDERFATYQDYWETDPKYLTDYGRLNKPGESLLYVSPSLECAIKEVHIQDDQPFAAIKYTAKTDIKVNMIGGEIDYEVLGIYDENAKLVHEIYNGFLRDEFSKDVGKGTEYLYKVSEVIAKDYFDLPPRVAQDAWAYSSVQDKSKYNVCFRPEIAHDLLELNGAMICKNNCTTGLRVHCVAIGVDDDKNIRFYKMGSDEQRQAFPEIRRID